jgi:hypothetical protein
MEPLTNMIIDVKNVLKKSEMIPTKYLNPGNWTLKKLIMKILTGKAENIKEV